MDKDKMIVEIWSDFSCPFCYIGKRRFNQALQNFEFKENIEVIWKSYLLSPHTQTDTSITIYDHLAQHRGVSVSKAKELFGMVSDLALKNGLCFKPDTMVVANTFNAHRLLQFARQMGLQNELAELLFNAHFCEGKNIDDADTLLELGCLAGLNRLDTEAVVNGNLFSNGVEMDVYEAKQVGLKGVPYFAYNDRFSVTGAQDLKVFEDVLVHAYSDWSKSVIGG